MKTKIFYSLPLLSLLAVFLILPKAYAADLALMQPSVGCDSLKTIDLTDIGGKGSKVDSTSVIKLNNAQWCKVEGTLAPEIGFRLLLPADHWNQRYMQVGCGGLCGSITLQPGAAAGCAPLNSNGFAVAATNMGHREEETNWGNDRQKRSDFAWRGEHLTALAAKKLIAAFYQKPAAFSYFNGCSDGGREALMAAQRFPHDFNGIVAGAAAMNFQVQNAMYHTWQVVSNRDKDGNALLTAKDLPLIHQAVMNQCDALDGQKDGLIAAPEACHPRLEVLRCKAEQQGKCLSDAQLTALKKLYDGPRDVKTGRKLIVGGPQYGSELAWQGVFIPAEAHQPVMSAMIALSSLRYVHFAINPAPGFTLSDVKFDQATFDQLSRLHNLYDATNPDLRAFARAGGKLIIWHGWADPHISPLNSIAYHHALGKEMGTSQRQAFERLYLLPGVYHCSNGEGPSLVDFMTPVMNWVENGQAPEAVTTWQASPQQNNSFGQPVGAEGKPTSQAALMQEGKPSRLNLPDMKLETIPANAASRPVYPYPQYAVWNGKGDVKQAASYVPKKLPVINEHYDWAGSGFYQPYQFIN
ncbi:tannase/feruloyl esterase family alpha/beta hydrolase [Mixta theicola]|uniref:Tannase/feruloyl esterase family alpha/beta hydrolase n=1 Tax=Mixta theicola TaxID=1458355 RepID=A0A2K1QEN4_9GAMM|nr:tannase/feruloyl esterase family alpha/beta hydrolase [Mixta theicola]PNS13483.1 tannase/feruloyl esterase family alpha/beta hydrolase [Mixta theicola]GLR09800.1 feruloyl esterase [Mixta theicola]